MFFKKTKKATKVIYILLFIIYFLSPEILPSVMHQLDIDTCLDTGVCAEGLEINTEYGRIKINKENCLKYSWKWNKDRNSCNLRSVDK